MAEITPEQKRLQLDKAVVFHQELFDKAGINKNDFRLKMAFYSKTGRHVVNIFASEFKREAGLYFEVVDRDYNPIDKDHERKIYYLPFNADFETEYEMTQIGSFHVPLEGVKMLDTSRILQPELPLTNITYHPPPVPVITPDHQPPPPPPPLDGPPVVNKSTVFPSNFEDASYDQMTIRDFVAIHTGKAVSGKPWLNELIKTLSTNQQ